MGKGKSGCASEAIGLQMEIPGSRPGELFTVTEGILDDSARAAFRFGHCHSLAIAVHQETGWPMLGLQHHSREISHVVVEMPDGRWLDASGAREADPEPYPGAKPPQPMSADEVRALGEQEHWLKADPRLAQSFVSPLLNDA